MPEPILSYEAWVASRGPGLTRDVIWRSADYRRALYCLYLGWDDARRLGRTAIAREAASQLIRALGSIPANFAEGYSRSSGLDRAKHFEYSLGSDRESVVWYESAIPVLGQPLVSDRQERLQQVARSLLAIIPRERRRAIRAAL